MMTLQREIRRKILEDIRINASKIRGINVIFDNTLYDVLPEALRLPETVDMMVAATQLGQLLGSFPLLENINIFAHESIGPQCSVVLATIALGCRQAKRLSLDLSLVHNETIPLFVSYIQDHPCLEEVHFKSETPRMEMRALLHPIATLPRLAVVAIDGFGDGIDEILAAPNLNKATLYNVSIDSEQEAERLCSALAASSMNAFFADEWTFPNAFGSRLAHAIVRSNITELNFGNLCNNEAFFETIGRYLAESYIECLDYFEPMGRSFGSALLGHTSAWRLHVLKLTLSDSQCFHTFQQLFESYLLRSDVVLRSLFLDIRQDVETLRKDLTKSLLSLPWSSATLDDIHFTIFGEVLEESWTKDIMVQVAANLNRQRRLHGPIFDNLTKVDAGPCRSFVLSKALAAIDVSTRFVFLSQNDWKCCDTLLQELPTVMSESKKRKRTG